MSDSEFSEESLRASDNEQDIEDVMPLRNCANLTLPGVSNTKVQTEDIPGPSKIEEQTPSGVSNTRVQNEDIPGPSKIEEQTPILKGPAYKGPVNEVAKKKKTFWPFQPKKADKQEDKTKLTRNFGPGTETAPYSIKKYIGELEDAPKMRVLKLVFQPLEETVIPPKVDLLEDDPSVDVVVNNEPRKLKKTATEKFILAMETVELREKRLKINLLVDTMTNAKAQLVESQTTEAIYTDFEVSNFCIQKAHATFEEFCTKTIKEKAGQHDLLCLQYADYLKEYEDDMDAYKVLKAKVEEENLERYDEGGKVGVEPRLCPDFPPTYNIPLCFTRLKKIPRQFAAATN